MGARPPPEALAGGPAPRTPTGRDLAPACGGRLRILIIVPALNEARSLPELAGRLRAAAQGCDVCVVDDGSSDATARVAGDLGFTVLSSPINLGIGGAVQTGYLWAHAHGYDAAVQMDADGQHDPADLASVVEPLRRGEASLVIGSRFLGDGGYRSTPVRRAGIRYLSWFLRLRCGASVTDPTSGYRAADRDAIAFFARSYPSDYPEPESIAFAVRRGFRVTEVPVRMAGRAHGSSSITAWRTLYYLVKVSLALVLLPARPTPANRGGSGA